MSLRNVRACRGLPYRLAPRSSARPCHQIRAHDSKRVRIENTEDLHILDFATYSAATGAAPAAAGRFTRKQSGIRARHSQAERLKRSRDESR
jgi:hypothetical protein